VCVCVFCVSVRERGVCGGGEGKMWFSVLGCVCVCVCVYVCVCVWVRVRERDV
jgi:hypothetical protein